METESVGASEGTVWLNAAEQARQLADARQSHLLEDQGVAVNTPARVVVQSPHYSPSLYAQAAQYQLYTQSGTLASLVQQGQVAPAEKPFHEHADAITAVDEAEGGSVDTFV